MNEQAKDRQVLGVDSGTYSLTEEELRSHGIIPGNTMGSERIKGAPLRVRFGNDLITRSAGGHLAHAFGYFTVEQAAARRAWSKRVGAAMNETPLATMRLTPNVQGEG